MLRWAHMLILLAGLGLLVAVAIEAVAEHDLQLAQEPQGILDAQAVSGAAPGFALPDRAGKVHSLDEFKGRWVLVVFWATWCEPCKDELPHLASLAMAFSKMPFYLVMISVDDGFGKIASMATQLREQAPGTEFPKAWEAAALFISSDGPNFITLVDTQAQVAHRYGTSKFPESYLIGPKGMLQKKFIGPKPWGMREAIGELKTMTSKGR